MCLHAYVCARVHVCYMPEDKLRYHSLEAFHLGFGNRISHWYLTMLGELARKPQQPTFLATILSYFLWFLMIRTKVPTLAWKALY